MSRIRLPMWCAALAVLFLPIPRVVAAAEHHANLKKMYIAEKAYAIPGHEVNLGSFFDVFAEFEAPPTGGSSTGFFDVFTEIRVDGGPFVPLSGKGTLVHRDSGLPYLEAEILSMSVSSSLGSPSLLMRESPTRPSLGQTKLTIAGRETRVDSFFDVFFDLSLDGGATWLSLTESVPLGTVPEPATGTLLAMSVIAATTIARRK